MPILHQKTDRAQPAPVTRTAGHPGEPSGSTVIAVPEASASSLKPGEVEIEPRAGHVLRVVTARTIRAWCHGCGATFTRTAQAAQHTRGRRHVVSVEYAASFHYAPVATRATS